MEEDWGRSPWINLVYNSLGEVIGEVKDEEDEELEAEFPHSDSQILHAPNKCKDCDEYPDLQDLRKTWNINFTNEQDPNKTMCPSEKEKPIDVLADWMKNT